MMTPFPFWYLAVFIPPLLVIEAFFAGAEIALMSADRIVLKTLSKKGSHRAKIALSLLEHPEHVLSVTLIMVATCVVGISTLATLYFHSRGYTNTELIALFTVTPIIVIFGELLPKSLGRKYANELAPWVAVVIKAVYYSVAPLAKFISWYTQQLSKFFRPLERILTGKRPSAREQLLSAIRYGKRDSEIKASEKRLIKRILDFKDSEARHALIPLVKVDAISKDSTLEQAFEKFAEHRHSRMPVFDDRVDNIVGLLELSDLGGRANLERSRDQHIEIYMSPAYYVAETHPLRDLIREMQHEDVAMAIVVDEYGGAIGILTLEDIIEEIVGEIEDEYDSENLPFREVTPGSSWVVQAKMEIGAIQESIGLELPEGDYETLAGFLLQQFGRIPETGDELFFTTGDGEIKFTVRKASLRQVETVLVERVKSLTQPENQQDT